MGGATTRVSDKQIASMDTNANYIPLGVKIEEGPQSKSRGAKVIGQTPEERKAIAREIRLAQRKEKKRIKSEAKQQRKLNDLLHRKLNRKTEKYSKNKDRNKQRAIDLERQKIRADAVKQAERLSAIHDPSGKIFNVGEITILPGGVVNSKEGMRRAAEAKERKEAEGKDIEKRYKDAEKAAKFEAEEAQRAIDQGLPAPTRYPAKEALKNMQRPMRISKKQLQRQEQLEPQPVPPKPVIPDGISLPEGEEDLLALWDITDEQITKRLANQKREKAQSRKQLIKIQQENKKLNKALKIRKREADNAGVIFDKEKARREILAAMTKDTESTYKSDSESDSSSGSDSDSESEDENVEVAKGNKLKAAPAPKLNLELIEKAAEIERARKEKKQPAKTKRRQERKQKAAEKAAKLEAERLVETKAVEEDQPAEETKQSRREKKAAKRAEKLAKIASVESSSKKRKRTEDEEVFPQDEPKKEKSHKKRKSKSETGSAQETKPAKKIKKVRESSDGRLDRAMAEREAKMAAEAEDDHDVPTHGAEQWNPDALTGDAARKDKFLRLLGAGKGSSKGVEKDKKKKDSGVDIIKIQEELERQFEAGVKLKHDGGSKKRGLGA